MKPERGKRLISTFLFVCFVCGIRSSPVVCFDVVALFPYPLPCHFGGWEGIQILGLNSGNASGSGMRMVPREGGLQPRVLPALRLSIVSAGWKETNAVAKCFCCGNAAVRVSDTAGSLAQSCSAEPRVGQRQIGHRQTKPPDVQKYPNIAEKHPENSHNLHLCCFINRQCLFFPSYNGDIS